MENKNPQIRAGKYPFVLASSSAGGGLGQNIRASSQVVAAQDDVLYIAAHGNQNGMRIVGNNVQNAVQVANDVQHIFTGRFALPNLGDRRVRWVNELGHTFGARNLGQAIVRGTLPFQVNQGGVPARFATLVLVSCSTGVNANPNGFPQQLSNTLGVSIIAPLRTVLVAQDGAHPVVRNQANTGYDPIGVGWRVFNPNVPVANYPGGNLPGWQ